MLMYAVRGLPLGRADRALLVRAEATWHVGDIVVLASLLARARRIGSPQARGMTTTDLAGDPYRTTER
jgi:hypothetical protein